MFSIKDDNIDLENIARCLSQFIFNNRNDVRIKSLPLDESSVKGRRIEERKDLWFIGDWAVQGVLPQLEAIWSIDVTPGETILLIVNIEKINHDYIVTQWRMKQALF